MAFFGFSGAKDTGNFRLNIQKNKTVVKSSITYHGLFHEYYFHTGKPETEKILSIEPFCGITKNLETQENEYYCCLATKSKYDGEGIKKFGRPLLNCVIVLDISGSMSCSFAGDRDQTERKSTKLEVAKRTILGLVKHLKDDDNFGIVIFDDSADELIEFKRYGDIDKEKMNEKITQLRTRGGTNMAEGFIEGSRMIDEYLKKQEKEDVHEHRILFLTDAHPTTGETRQEGLFSLAKKAAAKGIYTTFIGIGVDFNTELIEVISKTKGCNYYSVNSSSEFKRRMDTDFDYIMTPIGFDVVIRVEGAKILSIYGSPESDSAKDTTISKLSTVMPSNVDDKGETQGGVLVLKMDPTVSDGIPFKVIIEYKDKFEKEYQEITSVCFPTLNKDQSELFESSNVRKSVLLIRLVDLIKDFNNDEQSKQKARNFLDHLKSEIQIINDEKLNREVDLVNDLLN